MSAATSQPPSPERRSIGETTRPFGWVIVGTIVGAAIADACAENAPIVSTRWLTRHQTALAIAERTIPFLLVGCALGALLGWWAERRLGRRITLRRAVTYLVLFYVIAGSVLNVAQTLFDVFRSR